MKVQSFRSSGQPEPLSTPCDPFVPAAARLQELLLEELPWDAGEQIRQDLLALPSESRMAVFTNIATLLLTIALILNFLMTDDPLGGMSLSGSSLLHAALGIGYAAPLIALSLLCRAPFVHRRVHDLEAMHDAQETALQPLCADLDIPQMLIIAGCMSLPALLLLLPATSAGFVSLGEMLQDRVLAPIGMRVPHALAREFGILVPALSSACFAGRTVSKQLQVKRAHVAAIHSAVENSERYFRLSESMAAGRRDPSESTEAYSSRVTRAFAALSVVWLMTRRCVCVFVCVCVCVCVCASDAGFAAINDRILVLRFHPNGAIPMTAIVAYAPTEAADNGPAKDAFYEQLHDALTHTPAHHYILVMGDFNATTTAASSTTHPSVGRHACPTSHSPSSPFPPNSPLAAFRHKPSINDNGHRLLDLCSAHSLSITHSFFPNPPARAYTWYSRNRKDCNILDYILVRSSHLSS
ncbi:hypothetical protein FOA52_000677, partial [Chlamydomonas sp. UWO 241]